MINKKQELLDFMTNFLEWDYEYAEEILSVEFNGELKNIQLTKDAVEIIYELLHQAANKRMVKTPKVVE